MDWTSSHLSLPGSNPYVAFLLHEGIQTARAIGRPPDRSTADRLAAMREELAIANGALPSGAYMVDALAYESPSRLSRALPRLGTGMAAIAAHERLRRAENQRR